MVKLDLKKEEKEVLFNVVNSGKMSGGPNPQLQGFSMADLEIVKSLLDSLFKGGKKEVIEMKAGMLVPDIKYTFIDSEVLFEDTNFDFMKNLFLGFNQWRGNAVDLVLGLKNKLEKAVKFTPETKKEDNKK